MKSDLDIFKKHLGEIQGVNEFKANQICSQINDANDFIGALQVLDMSLKKIEKSILERIDENSDDMQKELLMPQRHNLYKTALSWEQLFLEIFSMFMLVKNFLNLKLLIHF